MDKAAKWCDRHRPRFAWFSPPCTAWSPLQNFNQKNRLQRSHLNSCRVDSRQLIRGGLHILFLVAKRGGHVYFEWPLRASGWKLPEIARFKGQLAAIRKSGRYFLLKPWRILTSDPLFQTAFGRRCPFAGKNGPEHIHKWIGGLDTTPGAFYPEAMALQIAKHWRKQKRRERL